MRHLMILQFLILFYGCTCNDEKSKNESLDSNKNINNVDTSIVNNSSNSNSLNQETDAEIEPLVVYPVDDSKKDNELKSFIDKLKTAIIKKDTQYVFNMVDDKITLTYNDPMVENSRAFLRKICRNDTILNEGFLKPLLRGISLGVMKNTLDSTEVYFPYVSQVNWYKGENNGFSVDLCAVSSNVPVFQDPDTNSKIVGRLNYEVVKVDYEKINKIKDKLEGVTYYSIFDNWYYVMKYDNKTKGFVEAKYLYSMMGYRGIFKKIKGQYLLTVFCSGD